MTVFVHLRDDPLGRLFARRRIHRSQYLAGRSYQEISDRAQIGNIRSAALGVAVDGGRALEPLTDARKRAAAKLRTVELAIGQRFRVGWRRLTRAVLAERKSVEQVARNGGAANDREVRYWGWLFRRCLDTLAQRLGFATGGRRYHAPREGQLDHPDLDRDDMHAVNGELVPDSSEAWLHAGLRSSVALLA